MILGTSLCLRFPSFIHIVAHSGTSFLWQLMGFHCMTRDILSVHSPVEGHLHFPAVTNHALVNIHDRVVLCERVVSRSRGGADPGVDLLDQV